MKSVPNKKTFLSLIALITLILFIPTSTQAAKNVTAISAPAAHQLLLAKGQYYVPPPCQKECSCSCEPCEV